LSVTGFRKPLEHVFNYRELKTAQLAELYSLLLDYINAGDFMNVPHVYFISFHDTVITYLHRYSGAVCVIFIIVCIEHDIVSVKLIMY